MKHTSSLQYIGEGPSGVRIGDREIQPGDVVVVPAEDADYYLGRGFVAVDVSAAAEPSED